MRKEPRLRFTDEERADPALEKPIRKVDRAAVKADTVSYTHLDVYKRQGLRFWIKWSCGFMRI